MSTRVLTLLFISNNLCDFSKQRGFISFELVMFIFFPFFSVSKKKPFHSFLYVCGSYFRLSVRGDERKEKQARNKQTNRQKKTGRRGTTPSLPSPPPFLFSGSFFFSPIPTNWKPGTCYSVDNILWCLFQTETTHKNAYFCSLFVSILKIRLKF